MPRHLISRATSPMPMLFPQEAMSAGRQDAAETLVTELLARLGDITGAAGGENKQETTLTPTATPAPSPSTADKADSDVAEEQMPPLGSESKPEPDTSGVAVDDHTAAEPDYAAEKDQIAPQAEDEAKVYVGDGFFSFSILPSCCC